MNIMKFAVGFGIAVIFPMLVHYGVSTFSPSPDWNDYRLPDWEVLQESATAEERQAMEAERSAVRERFEEHAETFARHLFWVATPLALVALIAGAMLQVPTISTGLIFGAIFTLIDAYGNYWRFLPDGLRFASLLVAFVALVAIGYRQIAEKTAGEGEAAS